MKSIIIPVKIGVILLAFPKKKKGNTKKKNSDSPAVEIRIRTPTTTNIMPTIVTA